MGNNTDPRAGQGCYDSPAQRLREAPRASPPHANGRSGIGIPINLNGCPSKIMAIFEQSNYIGNFFRLKAPPRELRQEALSGHLNEQGEVSGSVHLHRCPQGPNPKSSNLAHADSTVSSW